MSAILDLDLMLLLKTHTTLVVGCVAKRKSLNLSDNLTATHLIPFLQSFATKEVFGLFTRTP